MGKCCGYYMGHLQLVFAAILLQGSFFLHFINFMMTSSSPNNIDLTTLHATSYFQPHSIGSAVNSQG